MKDYIALSYNRIAYEYDSKFKDIQYEKFTELLLPYKNLFNNKKLFDIGCGTGLLFDFLKEHSIPIDTFGIDISYKMLSAARRKNYSKLIQADIYNLPVKTDSIDCVTSITVINIFPDNLRSIFSEAARILKTNGLFFLSVLHSRFTDEFISILNENGLTVDFQTQAGQDSGLVCFKN